MPVARQMPETGIFPEPLRFLPLHAPGATPVPRRLRRAPRPPCPVGSRARSRAGSRDAPGPAGAAAPAAGQARCGREAGFLPPPSVACGAERGAGAGLGRAAASTAPAPLPAASRDRPARPAPPEPGSGVRAGSSPPGCQGWQRRGPGVCAGKPRSSFEGSEWTPCPSQCQGKPPITRGSAKLQQGQDSVLRHLGWVLGDPSLLPGFSPQ